MMADNCNRLCKGYAQPCKLSFQAVAVFPSIFKSIGIRIQNG
ncbi:Uncharacterised protein [uncultured Oscillibacter sp.]|nr:Uncharacterised protein [uncultured Oscillibacter sp.]